MVTIKLYTDLQQSKKLAEILPLETADMHYSRDFDGSWFVDLDAYASIKLPKYVANVEEHLLPCWSLAALLDILESEIDGKKGETYQLNIEKDGTCWYIWYEERNDEAKPIEITSTEELIDACYEMILKLHELKIL